jgi:hypothetical protein
MHTRLAARADHLLLPLKMEPELLLVGTYHNLGLTTLEDAILALPTLVKEHPGRYRSDAAVANALLDCYCCFEGFSPHFFCPSCATVINNAYF